MAALWDWIYKTFGLDHLMVIVDLIKSLFA